MSQETAGKLPGKFEGQQILVIFKTTFLSKLLYNLEDDAAAS